MFAAVLNESRSDDANQSQVQHVDEANAIGTLDAAIDSLEELDTAVSNADNQVLVNNTSPAKETEAETDDAPTEAEQPQEEPPSTTDTLLQPSTDDAEHDAALRRNRRMTRRQDNRYHSGTFIHALFQRVTFAVLLIFGSQ